MHGTKFLLSIAMNHLGPQTQQIFSLRLIFPPCMCISLSLLICIIFCSRLCGVPFWLFYNFYSSSSSSFCLLYLLFHCFALNPSPLSSSSYSLSSDSYNIIQLCFHFHLSPLYLKKVIHFHCTCFLSSSLPYLLPSPLMRKEDLRIVRSPSDRAREAPGVCCVLFLCLIVCIFTYFLFLTLAMTALYQTVINSPTESWLDHICMCTYIYACMKKHGRSAPIIVDNSELPDEAAVGGCCWVSTSNTHAEEWQKPWDERLTMQKTMWAHSGHCDIFYQGAVYRRSKAAESSLLKPCSLCETV